MTRFRLAAAAESDLRSIEHYIARESSVETARSVVSASPAAIRGLAEMPGTGHTREDLTEEPVLFWPVHSYLIVYRADSMPLEVVRVVPGRRDVESELE